ncbi:hypothetical protein [Cronobacter dublinensis]|uniref:hypothetical protein n=1 Tax=Cronobacter dublinensis TaxID=413497 RepID=UPI001F1858D3|nr:hypothetical protein [Cronobacter dublinensis]
MSLTGHLKGGVVATLAVTLLGGCIPYPRERPGYIDLCKSEYEFSIDSPGGKKSIVIETWLYDHAIPGDYMPEKQGHFTLPHVQGPEARPEFYVQLVAYNKGRQRPSRPGSKGQPPVPVMLDTRKAYLDLGNGKRISARPEVFLGTTSFPYDFPEDNVKYARPSPYDINSDEVHRNVPRITNNDDYGSAYVVFKIYREDANVKWTIYPGELESEGQKIPLPALKLCWQPTLKWIGIEPLMRP